MDLPAFPRGLALPDELSMEPFSDAEYACLREAAKKLTAALLHVVNQPTSKGRDRALAALIALIYGPTPFGGANTFKEVAMRYGMTEQNLYSLMRTLRALLQPESEPEWEI